MKHPYNIMGRNKIDPIDQLVAWNKQHTPGERQKRLRKIHGDYIRIYIFKHIQYTYILLDLSLFIVCTAVNVNTHTYKL